MSDRVEEIRTLQDFEIKNLLANWRHLNESSDDYRRILYQALDFAFSEIQRLRDALHRIAEADSPIAGEQALSTLEVITYVEHIARDALSNTLEQHIPEPVREEMER